MQKIVDLGENAEKTGAKTEETAHWESRVEVDFESLRWTRHHEETSS